jgi:hypothetical protein
MRALVSFGQRTAFSKSALFFYAVPSRLSTVLPSPGHDKPSVTRTHAQPIRRCARRAHRGVRRSVAVARHAQADLVVRVCELRCRTLSTISLAPAARLATRSHTPWKLRAPSCPVRPSPSDSPGTLSPGTLSTARSGPSNVPGTLSTGRSGSSDSPGTLSPGNTFHSPFESTGLAGDTVYTPLGSIGLAENTVHSTLGSIGLARNTVHSSLLHIELPAKAIVSGRRLLHTQLNQEPPPPFLVRV